METTPDTQLHSRNWNYCDYECKNSYYLETWYKQNNYEVHWNA